jgi:3-dehydroquinate dehydratase-2
MTATIYVLNGPNLNLLGTREPDVYGTMTLGDIEQACNKHAATLSVGCDFRQTNSEGELVSWLQEAGEKAGAVIINAGAYTHTSVAILDAIKTLTIPVIEVHLSNIFQREAFRHHSYVSLAATGVICGFGATGYRLALDAAASLVSDE